MSEKMSDFFCGIFLLYHCVMYVYIVEMSKEMSVFVNIKNPPCGGFLYARTASSAEGKTFAFFVVHMYGAAGDKIASEDALCQWVFQMRLDGAF